MNFERKYNILIVEDDTYIASLVKDLLNEEQDYQAISVSNGKAAIELLNKSYFDLLILDIGLPGISGIQIYDWLQSQNNTNNLSVMFMTAQSNQYRSELEKRQVAHIMQKPFDLEEFLNMTRQALAHRVNRPSLSSNRSNYKVSFRDAATSRNYAGDSTSISS